MSTDFDIDALLERLRSFGDAPFLQADGGSSTTYADLLQKVDAWRGTLADADVPPGPVGLAADYSADGIAALLALWSTGRCVGLLPSHAVDVGSYAHAGHLNSQVLVRGDGSWELSRLEAQPSHPLLEALNAAGHPGLVLYSSGSSGEPKAVLHDLNTFIGKFRRPGKRLKTYAFLIFDHVAGQDTLLYTLCAGGTLVAGDSRRPEAVARLIEKFAVQVLPASPTFLNLLLLSGVADDYALGSVEIITYGSEPMDDPTLSRLAEVFPNAKIVQKYGTSEFGAIRSISKSNDSTFIKIKRDETDYRVEDGMLWVKPAGTMLGYLNAPSGVGPDGWICTGDLVEQDGEWLRVLGRQSDIINVGGETVVPAEVEATIRELPFVLDCLVRGERQPIVGVAVVAEVAIDQDPSTLEPRERRDIGKRIRRHCLATLPAYKVPVKFDLVAELQANDRQKKIRRERDTG